MHSIFSTKKCIAFAVLFIDTLPFRIFMSDLLLKFFSDQIENHWCRISSVQTRNPGYAAQVRVNYNRRRQTSLSSQCVSRHQARGLKIDHPAHRRAHAKCYRRKTFNKFANTTNQRRSAEMKRSSYSNRHQSGGNILPITDNARGEK